MAAPANKTGKRPPAPKPGLISWVIGIAIGGSIFLALLFGIFGLLGYLLLPPALCAALAFPIEEFSRAKSQGMSVSRSLLEGLRSFFVYPLLALGMVAPGRAIMWGFFYFIFKHKNPALTFREIIPLAKVLWHWPPFDLIVSICGILLGTLGAGITVALIIRQARLVENLPTSRVRSAALGLAEFKGVARPVEDKSLQKTELVGDSFRDEIYRDTSPPILFWGEKDQAVSDQNINRVKKLSRFYLEDKTGRILVDPLGADFWASSKASFLEPIRKVILTRRHKQFVPENDKVVLSVETRELLAGDPVYVLGNVEINEDAPADAVGVEKLIVRPSTAPVKPGLLTWLFFNSETIAKSRDYRYVFLLTDTAEKSLPPLLRRGIRHIGIAGLVWAVPSIILLSLALKML